jgi:hypothetical protein
VFTPLRSLFSLFFSLSCAIFFSFLLGTSIDEIGVAMQGSNGLLSNLDLINVITKARMKKRTLKCKVIDVTRIESKNIERKK